AVWTRANQPPSALELLAHGIRRCCAAILWRNLPCLVPLCSNGLVRGSGSGFAVVSWHSDRSDLARQMDHPRRVRSGRALALAAPGPLPTGRGRGGATPVPPHVQSATPAAVVLVQSGQGPLAVGLDGVARAIPQLA